MRRRLPLLLALLAAAAPRPGGAARAAGRAALVQCATPAQVQAQQRALMKTATVLFAYEWGPSDVAKFGGSAEAQAGAQLDRIATQLPQLEAQQQAQWRNALVVAKARARPCRGGGLHRTSLVSRRTAAVTAWYWQ